MTDIPDAITHLILDAIEPGAILLGAFAASILYGITCLQAYIFFYKNHRDTLIFKLIIYGLWILDTLHLAMVIHALYYYLIVNYGRPTLKPIWSLYIQVIVTLCSDFVIRTIFGKRVWTLNRSYILTGGIAATTAACSTTGAIFVVKAFPLAGFTQIHAISAWLYASLATGAASDIIVAISLCIGLHMKARTGFRKSDSLVHILMAYAINTSLLTTICSIACLITYAVWPEKLIFLSIYFCMNKFYFNSLLAALNARHTLREKISGLLTAPSSVTVGGNNAGQTRRLSGMSYYKEAGSYELESPANQTSPVRKNFIQPSEPPSGPKIVINIDREITVDESPGEGAIGTAF